MPTQTPGLEKSGQTLSPFANAVQAGILVIDEETHLISEINQAAARMIGREPAEILGNRCHCFICPAESGRCPVSDLGQHLDNSERILLAADGTKLPILKSVVRVTADNRPRLVETLVAIPPLKRAEESLRESNSKFRLLFQSNPLPMWVFDLKTLEILEVNDVASMSYGYSRDEFLAMRITDIRPSEDLESFRPNLARKRQAVDRSGPWRHRFKDGRIINVEIVSHLVEWNGRAAVLVVARDISGHRRMEECLRESEARFRTAFEHAPIGMCLTGLDGRFLQVNEALSKMLGYSRQELLAGAWQRLTYPEDIAASRAVVKQFMECGANSMEFDKRYVHKNGTPIWSRLRISVVRDSRGVPSYFITHVENISERRRAEEALRESQEKIQRSQEQYMLAVKGSNDGIWDWDLRAGEEYFSPQWKSMIGYEDSELPNHPSVFEEHLHPDDRPRVLERLRRYLKGEDPQYKVEFRFRHKDGSYLWILARGEALRDEHGLPYRIAGSHTDITDRKRAQELSRLSGMAEIATAVLHNVGNVLNSVNVAANLISTKTRELRVDRLAAAVEMLEQHANDLATFLVSDSKGQRIIPYLAKLTGYFKQERQSLLTELDRLREHVEHIKRVVATQQSYAKVSGLTEEISLPALVEDAFGMIQPRFDRHNITVEKQYEELPAIFADKHPILQIVLNLLRNAIDAVKSSDNSKRLIQVAIRRLGENRVRIEVKDSGIGVPPENLTRIFAHGFTTKQSGHGFGLHSGALAAQKMGGRLWAESEGLGCGATFILELPWSNKAKAQE